MSPTSVRKTLLAPGLVILGTALPLVAGAAYAQTPPAAQTSPATSPVAVPAVDPSKVVARVNGVDITEGDLAIAAEDPGLQMPNVPDEQKRELLTGYMIDLKLGAKAAEAAKVGSGAEFARKLAYNRDKTLLDEYLNETAKKAVNPEAARKLYEETVKSVPAEQEVRARHILVENEDEAKAIATRVKGGEDFAKVAGEVSKDPGSKTDGGDLGFFTKDRMVEPFAEAAFKLEPGQISDPVKSQFGWHVIRVEEKRTKPAPTFEETKDQVESYLGRKAQQDLIVGLRKDAKIERLDDKGNLVQQKQP
jgi:peptidyl-prolyl cis-trans isomerase C